MIFRIIFTAIFGFLWWWCFNHVGAAYDYLMILGSVLAVCACCCQGNPSREPGQFNYKNWFACIQRCWLATITLMVGLVLLAVLVVLFLGTGFGGGVAGNILIASIGAPLFVRLICCAYES